MLHRLAFIRAVALPACLIWALMESFALLRAHQRQRKMRAH
jgi:hypothetical protein